MHVKLSLIVAAARNGVIGRRNQLPWRLPDDLKRFKAVTMGKPVIMGRKTWESIGRPLPGRLNIVVTRQPDYRAEGASVAHSLGDALAAAGAAEEVMVIGGAELYAAALPRAEVLHLTRVEADVEGDAFLPAIDWSQWRLVSAEPHPFDDKHALAFVFETYIRC